MSFRKFDLNLLLVLDALLDAGSATAAAQRLGLTQPTVSGHLQRLREAFGDPLFVKHAGGLAPTPRALALREPLALLLATLNQDIIAQQAFDPAASERTFVLLAGEIGQMIFVHRLMRRLRALAPRVAVKVIAAADRDGHDALQSGRAELAIGYYPQFAKTNLYQQRLYERPLVCLTRKENPALEGGALTLERFCAMEHAILGPESHYFGPYRAAMQQLGLRPRVAIELANVAGAPHILAHSDMIAVVPEALARICCGYAELEIHAVPLAVPPVQVKQYWHPQLHHDPGLRWLRQLIAADFQEMDRAG